MNQQNSHAQRILAASYRRVYSKMRWLNALAERGMRPVRMATRKLQSAARSSTVPRRRGFSFAGLRLGGMESLETRSMLAADLTFGENTQQLTDFTLGFNAGTNEYELAGSSGTVVSTALKADADAGGIQITGPTAEYVLTLDVASLANASPTIDISVVGEDQAEDTVRVQLDSDFSVFGSVLTVGETEFTLTGFERLALFGGNSANTFTLEDIDFNGISIDGGDSLDTIASENDGNEWIIGLEEAPADAGILNNSTDFTSVENIIGGIGADGFEFTEGASITGTIDGGGGEDGLDYAAYATAISVDLSSGLATGMAGFSNITNVTGSAAANDELHGPAADVEWRFTGLNEGVAYLDFFGDQLAFFGIEQFFGADDFADSYVFDAGSELSGVIYGGTGGPDTLVLQDDTTVGGYVPVNVSDAGSGTVEKFGYSITYDGIEPIISGTSDHRLVYGTSLADAYQITTATAPGYLQVANKIGEFFDASDADPANHAVVAFLEFAEPTQELRIALGWGNDEVSVGEFITDALSYAVVVDGGLDENILLGADRGNTWKITSEDAGLLNEQLTFQNFYGLGGGTADDEFIFIDSGSLTGVAEGGKAGLMFSTTAKQRQVGHSTSVRLLILTRLSAGQALTLCLA